MHDTDNILLAEIPFVKTAEHECSYLEGHDAVTIFVNPDYAVEMNQYTFLARFGFRRSGENIYRPHCSHCALCIPVRIPVEDFTPNRSQKRNKKLNQDISIVVKDAVFEKEHYALYRTYMSARHSGGGMDEDAPESYETLLKAKWSTSKILEFKLDEKLIMVAVIDCFDNGVSAVYTFFEPEYSNRGLGVFGILSQIDYVKSLGLEWLYLGYWNPKTQKMSYKSNYHPIEFYDGQEWQRLKKST